MQLYLLLSLLGILPWALAGNSTSGSALSALPECAQECLATAISNSDCNPNNVTCTCTTTSIQVESAACISRTCTVKEALFTKNATSSSCDVPIRDKTQTFINVTITLGVISGVVVLLRVGSKVIMKLDFFIDDWLILTTLLCGIPSSVMNVIGTAGHGEGKDIWTLTFQSITTFGLYFYVLEVFYFAQVSLLKMTLLFFYLRIFPAKRPRRLLLGTVIFNAVYGIAFVFLAIFQCQPISHFWTGWDGEHQGSCLNVNAIGWANAVISITLDVWMIGIPLWHIRSLKLHWKKKVGVALMFLVGTFVTVVSIVRLQFLVDLGSSTNPTFDQTDVSIWSTVEINIGIICTCMPSLRLLLIHLFPILGGSSYNTSGYQNYGETNGNRSNVHRSRTRPPAEIGKSQNRPEPDGIELQKTYQVWYNDADEASLVERREIGVNAGQSSVSVKNTSEVSF